MLFRNRSSRSLGILLFCGITLFGLIGFALWEVAIRPWQSREVVLERLPVVPEISGHGPELRAEIHKADLEARDDPLSSEKVGVLAITYHANYAFEEARACYQAALLLSPHDPRWNYYLAVVEESLGNDDQAIQLLEELTRQHPDNPSFNSRLGHLLLRNSRIESARITFERALTVDPDHLIASLGLARILAWERNWEAVFHSLQPVIEERPLFGPAVRLLARACRETARDCPSERSPEENTVESLVEDHLLEALADRSVLAFLRGNVGQGETIVQKRCSRCHSMERIQTGDKTSRQWLRTVRKMQTLAGHEWLSDQDAADILAYLSSRRP